MFTLLQTQIDSAYLAQYTPEAMQSQLDEFIEALIENPQLVFQTIADDLLTFAVKVLAALIIIFIGSWIIRKIKKTIRRAFEKNKRADNTIGSFVASLAGFMLWVPLILMTAGTLGIDTTSFAALLAAGGMAIGMALSGAVQNFAGGLLIMAFKPFRHGDFIEAQGYCGTVKEINILNTLIATPDNTMVYLPNGSLSSGSIKNYHAHSMRRIDFNLTLEYGSDPEKVFAACKEVVAQCDKILTQAKDKKTPADPRYVVSNMLDSAVEFRVRVWVYSEDYWDVVFWGNEHFYTHLPKRGLSFAFPHMQVILPSEK